MARERHGSKDRGYGHAHRQLRKKEARKVKAGLAYCWRCLKEGRSESEAWISPDEPFDLGHDDRDRTIYRGVEHRACNRRTSTRRAQRRRRPAKAHPGLIDLQLAEE